jgi:hypothetical protein
VKTNVVEDNRLSDAHDSNGAPKATPSEQLVAVRAEVLSDAEHALGNLFQRIYHLTRLTRDGLGTNGERLTSAVENVERLLELLFDYVSPVEVELRSVAAQKVVESLASQVRSQSSAEVATADCPPVYVVADARLLRRTFQLLVRAFARDLERASRIALGVSHDAERTEIGARIEVADPNQGGADANLAVAVAARLIDLNGGELRHRSTPDGVSWSVALPTGKEDHVAL